MLDVFSLHLGQEVCRIPDLREQVTLHWLTLSSGQLFLVISQLYIHAMTYCNRRHAAPWPEGVDNLLREHDVSLCPGGHSAFIAQQGQASTLRWWEQCVMLTGPGGSFPSDHTAAVFPSCLSLPAIADSCSINHSLKTGQLWKQRI